MGSWLSQLASALFGALLNSVFGALRGKRKDKDAVEGDFAKQQVADDQTIINVVKRNDDIDAQQITVDEAVDIARRHAAARRVR